jgi:hypothetical protein
MIKKIWIIIFLILTVIKGFGQAEIEVTFEQEILQLNQYGEKIISSDDDAKKQELNQKYKSLLLEVINNKDAFNYNFDSLKTISILQEDILKIYNWTLPKSDGSFVYYAYLTILTDDNTYKIIELIDKSDEIKSPENKILTPKMWYGALYYKIIHHKKLGYKYYTLLGWDGNNNLTNKKIIDVIQINQNGSIKIGAPIFKMKKKTQRRVIFEYSENAVMSLKYHPKEKKIVFDFLVPESSKLKGIPEYYGPALNRFDALNIGKGKWTYEADTKIELDRTIKDHFWIDPKEK